MKTETLDHNLEAECASLDFAIKHVYALGLTYRDHLREVGEKPGKPVVFRKACLPTVSNRSELVVPTQDELFNAIEKLDHAKARWLEGKFAQMPSLLDYEVEVALICLEDLHPEQLNDTSYRPHIAYGLTNDLTARSVQIAGEGAQDKLAFWAASKSFSGFLPMAEQIWIPRMPDLERFPDFSLKTYVNGELRQSASSTEILYSPRQMLEMAIAHSKDGYLSKHDMILTGTPSGVALSIPRWKRRLATCLPAKLRILAALRGNNSNPNLLSHGDVVKVCGGVLGKQTTHVIVGRQSSGKLDSD